VFLFRYETQATDGAQNGVQRHIAIVDIAILVDWPECSLLVTFTSEGAVATYAMLDKM